jgi:dUTP pyrophosphatase
MVKIKFKKLYSDAIIPKQMREGDAGLDIYSYEDALLEPLKVKLVKTGVSVEIPPEYEGQVRPRSGLAINHSIGVLNSPGTIDSNYRGEVCIILINFGDKAYQIKKGDRIAQLVIASVPKVMVGLSEELTDTVRGSDGFGSSGKK